MKHPNCSKSNKDDQIIEQALAILERRINYDVRTNSIASPAEAINYAKLQLSHLEYEVFGCLFLNNKHRVLKFEKLFRGTIDGASIYPREVVKEALSCNAAAVIFMHNHPSGCSEPSQSDISITSKLKEALSLVDIRVLDHLIVGEQVISFAERGLL